VIEAGLGGRLDATNVIPSRITVLTSVGLDHTEWLGDTLEEIAAEKLAVLRDHTTLLLGEVPSAVQEVVKREADKKHARAHWVAGGGAAPVGYQTKNFLLAMEAASEALAGLDERVVQELGGRLQSGELIVPGRAQVVHGDPSVIFDAAHNPQGALALADALPRLARSHDVVCCLAVLAEKDARQIIRALAPACARFVCTQIPEEVIRGSGRPVGESYSAADLAEICRELGAEAEAVEEPLAAWRQTKELARQQDGVALAAGSHYLLSCIWTERPDQSS
jgi:dihydrofolate synthase/folylpolyglutamate synthase